mmetsp:Transcript_106886/g.312489  ORF Transcript_106886/g.312489 Transcript_106886/m.312489 type:complete len:238 (+) Transcript_106886:290-1003(+)
MLLNLAPFGRQGNIRPSSAMRTIGKPSDIMSNLTSCTIFTRCFPAMLRGVCISILMDPLSIESCTITSFIGYRYTSGGSSVVTDLTGREVILSRLFSGHRTRRNILAMLCSRRYNSVTTPNRTVTSKSCSTAFHRCLSNWRTASLCPSSLSLLTECPTHDSSYSGDPMHASWLQDSSGPRPAWSQTSSSATTRWLALQAALSRPTLSNCHLCSMCWSGILRSPTCTTRTSSESLTRQ